MIYCQMRGLLGKETCRLLGFCMPELQMQLVQESGLIRARRVTAVNKWLAGLPVCHGKERLTHEQRHTPGGEMVAGGSVREI